MKSIIIVTLSALLPVVCTAQQAAKPVAKVSVPNSTRQDATGTTIYKLVDERGHVTYSNRPMKGAEVVELEPITVIPAGPRLSLGERPQVASVSLPPPSQPSPANAPSTMASGNTHSGQAGSPASSMVPTSASGNQVALVQPILPSVDTDTQKKRDDSRRRILEEEMKTEQKLLADAVIALSAVESDRTAIEQMRQAAAKQTPAAYAEARRSYEQREERLRAMQETVSTHEKNVTALKRELSALR